MSAPSGNGSPRCRAVLPFSTPREASQVPDEVGDAIARALREASANLGAVYDTSLRVKEILETAESGAARLLGCDPQEITFGPNMTSLDFALSRTAGRDFAPGDEILVSSLDHDGGVAPWLELAHDRDLVVRHIELKPDTTLDYEDLEQKLGPRTRVVAFAWASNAVGTVVDAQRVCRMAHDAGALAWIDAVHYAAHEPIDVREIDADVLICSPYKFCGPHLGVAYGRAQVTELWRPYKARPAPTTPLGRRFATGTLPYELLAGFNATLAYLESIGGFEAIVPYERSLGERFLASAGGRPDGLRAADDGGSRADVPGQRPRACRRPTSSATSPSAASACGRTTPGTRWTSTGASATRTRRSGSASSTTTPRRRSTGSWRRCGRPPGAGAAARGRRRYIPARSASNSSTSRLRASHSLGQLALGDQLAEHLHGRALRADRVLAERPRDVA